MPSCTSDPAHMAMPRFTPGGACPKLWQTHQVAFPMGPESRRPAYMIAPRAMAPPPLPPEEGPGRPSTIAGSAAASRVPPSVARVIGAQILEVRHHPAPELRAQPRPGAAVLPTVCPRSSTLDYKRPHRRWPVAAQLSAVDRPAPSADSFNGQHRPAWAGHSAPESGGGSPDSHPGSELQP